MSYMDHKAAFGPIGGIQEMSFDEIEEINGSVLPLLAIAYVGIGLSVGTLAVGGGVVFGLRLVEAVNLK